VHKMFEVQSVLQRELVSQVIPGTAGLTFLGISKWEELWQWTDGVLVKQVYGEDYWPDASGGARRAPYSMFTVGKYNRVLSAIRFRQVRVKPTLSRCPRNSMGILPTEYESACTRGDANDMLESCDTPLGSHTLSRPCWGAWTPEHQEKAYPGQFEKATSKITFDATQPEKNIACIDHCEAYFVHGHRTADQYPGFGLPGVTQYVVDFVKYLSPAISVLKCKEACDVSGTSWVEGLPHFSGNGGNPNFYGSADVIDLPLNASKARPRLAAMHRERWTSESTRALIVEINTYNPNYDVAAVVRLVIDANPGGLLEPHFEVASCLLANSGSTMDTARLVLEILFACWLFYYLAIEFSEMYFHKWKYWADAWNYIELANVAGYAYGLIVWWTYITKHNFADLRKRDPDNFKDLHTAAAEFNSVALVASGCILFMCMRFFKYFRLSVHLRMFWDTLRVGLGVIVPLLLVYVGCVIAFSWSGHWLFGQRVRVFSSLSSAVMYVLLSVRDGMDYVEMKEASPAAAPLWYFCWYLLSKVTVVGLIIAICTVVFGEMHEIFHMQAKARDEAKRRGSKIPRLRDYFIMDFCPAALVSAFIPGLNKKDRVEAQDTHTELKETLSEVDLELLWDRALQGLHDGEYALDAGELAFLFGRGQGKAAEKSARYFINRICTLASLNHAETDPPMTILDEVIELETKVESIVTHIHAARKGLEQRFHKLRPYIARAREQDMAAETAAAAEDPGHHHGGAGGTVEHDRQVRYVLKEGMYIDDIYYLVEMSTVGHQLHISAFDAASERTFDLFIKGRDYKRALMEAAYDHTNIANRLQHGVAYGPGEESVTLELGPPQDDIVRLTTPRKIERIRPGNSVFQGGEDGVQPPQRGQLKIAGAVLDSQKKGRHKLGNVTNVSNLDATTMGMGDISARDVIQNFVQTKPLLRME